MKITGLTKIGKSHYKVYTDGRSVPAFELYGSDLRSLDLHDGSEISEEKYKKITEELLPKRALSRVCHLIEKRDYTERQIRDKLSAAFYPGYACDFAVETAKKHGLINDRSYSIRYTECYQDRKSIGRIRLDLMRKGIDQDFINEAISSVIGDSREGEKEKIKKILLKRGYDKTASDRSETEKQVAYLYRRGFRIDDIRACLRDSDYLT
ncbi:MAG: recombination regulator RecX [Lachnospiraceae bacterium]|nr:recombination regulator RecX [Lachnospiraceae bacterium]